MQTDELERLHVNVQGRVQGVGFRHFAMLNASGLGLTGWVRNRLNGDVEVLAEGRRADLDKLLHALHRGPSSAYVTEVRAEWGIAGGSFSRFNVRATE